MSSVKIIIIVGLMKMRKIVYDIEANSLTPTRIWCVVAHDVETNEVFTFLEGERDKFAEFCKGVSTFIGHNIIQYDNYWLQKLWGIPIPTSKSIDTLVLSRLFNPCREARKKKGDKWVNYVKQKRMKNQHSLAAWGEFLGYPKIEFSDFSKFSEEMLKYCRQDVNVNVQVYNYLRIEESKGFSKKSIEIEHKLQEILCNQMRNGFLIDIPKAKKLLDECTTKAVLLSEEMHRDFPPLPVEVREVQPRLNKDGVTYNRGSMGFMGEQYGFGYDGEPYSIVKWVEFNLSSPIQVVARLEGYWNPTDLTPKGQPKLSDINLATISEDAPESIKQIKLYRMYSSRINELTSWISGAEKHNDSRLRGNIYHLGGWSGRASHSDPNTANIVGITFKDGDILYGEEGNYGYECRDVWTVEEGNVLVGCDASGIQLRILAHYLNNEEYTKSVLSEKPNDIHTKNSKLLGCLRDDAKTFIYSWLLGAGVVKTAHILSCSIGEAVQKRDRFVIETPGLGEFLKRKSVYAQRGWYHGLDGRKVYIPSDHLALTAFLQNGEHVIMALSAIYWTRWATQRGIKFKLVGYIHDEFQVECEAERADELGYLMEQSFIKTGEYLNMNCPLAGEYKVGSSWAHTH